MSRKLKTAVIREELVALTGHFMSALILNQFIYWSERTRDTDQYLQEEQRRMKTDTAIQPTHGWIYKNAQELSDELMLDCTAVTIRKYIKPLVESGYLDERTNPLHHWDRTLQYRPNMVKIQTALGQLGYSLEGYPLQVLNYDGSNLNYLGSSPKDLGALPETTTKTTTKKEDAPPPAPKLAPHQANMLAREKVYDPNTPPELKDLCLALKEVTLSSNWKALETAADTLTYDDVTPEEIRLFYTGANCYWRMVDFVGKQGERPQLGNILGTVLKAREWLTNGGAAETERATEAATLYREWIQPLAAMNGTAREYFKGAPSQVKRALSANGMGNIDQIKRVSEAEFAGWYAGVQ